MVFLKKRAAVINTIENELGLSTVLSNTHRKKSKGDSTHYGHAI